MNPKLRFVLPLLLGSLCAGIPGVEAQVDPALEVLALAQGVGVDVLEWDRLVDLGRRQLETGQSAEALETLLQADSIDIHEVPNYGALALVAEARCRLGQFELGRALLRDFRCALEVDRGKLPCFLGPETRTAPGHPNPELTPTCYERMCGEIYLSYYENPTAAMLGRIDAMSRDADRVEALCADPAPAQDEPERNDSLRRP
jgi:hypothetical protein